MRESAPPGHGLPAPPLPWEMLSAVCAMATKDTLSLFGLPSSPRPLLLQMEEEGGSPTGQKGLTLVQHRPPAAAVGGAPGVGGASRVSAETRCQGAWTYYRSSGRKGCSSQTRVGNGTIRTQRARGEGLLSGLCLQDVLFQRGWPWYIQWMYGDRRELCGTARDTNGVCRC